LNALCADRRNQRVRHNVVSSTDGVLDLDANLCRCRRFQRVEYLQKAIHNDGSARQGDVEIVPPDRASIVYETPAGDYLAVGLPFLVGGIVNPRST
jgi:hypothetical protein